MGIPSVAVFGPYAGQEQNRVALNNPQHGFWAPTSPSALTGEPDAIPNHIRVFCKELVITFT